MIRKLLIIVPLALAIVLPAFAQKPEIPPTPEAIPASTEAPQVAPPEPTKPPPPPTERPYVPPTPEPPKPTIPPTPKPVKPTALPTPTPELPKPTVPPTPSRTATSTSTQPVLKSTASPTPGGVRQPDPANLPATSHPLPTASPSARVAASDTEIVELQQSYIADQVGDMVVAGGEITGLVFDDQNKNGMQDKGEMGLGDVAVTLNGRVVASSNAGGQFAVPRVSDARLAVVPPDGWQWDGQLRDQGDQVTIPLRKVSKLDSTATATAVSGGLAAGSLALLAVAGGLVFNSLSSLSQASAVSRLEKSYRRQKSLEMEMRMARDIADHTAYIRSQLEASQDAWRGVTSQLLANAGMGSVSLACVQGMSLDPCPHFSVVGSDGQMYVFATDPSRLYKRSAIRQARLVQLDTNLTLFARAEAQALWSYHAQQIGNPILPGDTSWYVVVPDQQSSSSRLRVVQRGWKRWIGFVRKAA